MSREDRQAGVARRDEHDHHPGGAAGLRVLDRRLVAVVAVGDHQLAVGEGLDDRVGLGEAPELRALDLELGLALRVRDGRQALVEQEDRLELRADGADEPQPALPRLAMRALVRQDDAALVGLDLERRDDPAPRPRDAVRADVVLLERPERRRLLSQHALLAPGREVARCLLFRVGQREVDDVVRALLEVRLPLVLGQHVVRGRDERLERPGALLVVAQRGEGSKFGHARTVP